MNKALTNYYITRLEENVVSAQKMIEELRGFQTSKPSLSFGQRLQIAWNVLTWRKIPDETSLPERMDRQRLKEILHLKVVELNGGQDYGKYTNLEKLFPELRVNSVRLFFSENSDYDSDELLKKLCDRLLKQ